MISNDKLECEYAPVEKGEEKWHGFGVRHVQVMLVFTCQSVAYIMRVDMSVAIVAMTDTSNIGKGIEIFPWPKHTQDVILSSFFWGYMLMQVPSGQLAQRYGAKRLLVVAILINGLASLLTPIAVHLGGWQVACACRMLQGLTQSCFFPCVNTLAARWIPAHEKSRLTNILFAGTPFGTILGMPLSSLLAASSWGWPLVFYAIGALGLLTGLLWAFQGASSPASHPSISKEERYFIENSLGQTDKQKAQKTPWRAIATCPAMWAMLVANVGRSWGFITLLVEIPSYLKMALGIDLKNSGLLSALPYVAMWLMSFGFSIISDYIINNGYCSKCTSRKIFNTIGTVCPGVMLVLLSYIPPGHEVVAVSLITLAVGINSAQNLGYMINAIDLAPNFAGTVAGISNCAANGIGILAPLTVGYLVTDETDQTQWRLVFFITSTIFFLSNLIFLIFGSSIKQPWNDPVTCELEMKTNKLAGMQKLEKEKMLQQNLDSAL